MKNIALALLLANLLLLAWQAWVVPPEQPIEQSLLPRDFSELKVLPRPEREMPPAAAPGDSVQLAGARPTGGCLRVGPFGRESDAQRVRAGLADKGISVRESAEDGNIWVGHWVQIRNLANRGVAEQALTRLAANGMQDAYIVAGTSSPSISLGVFRRRASVEIITGKAQELGFKADVSDRFQPGTNYWLEARLTDQQALPLRRLLKDMGQILRTESIACEEPA